MENITVVAAALSDETLGNSRARQERYISTDCPQIITPQCFPSLILLLPTGANTVLFPRTLLSSHFWNYLVLLCWVSEFTLLSMPL